MFAQNRVLSRSTLISAVVILTLAGSNLALGQGTTAQPGASGSGTAAPAVATNTIVVLAISGKVQFKADTGANLAELKVGQRLVPGSEIFTGANSIAQIKIGEGQVFTIDRIGRVLIKDAVKSAADGKGTTVLQLPYGRIRFDVTSTKVANDVKIQTPDATLAVKGTHGVIEKIPGQPTRAYGGELNAGIVNMMYVGGINVDVKKDDSSSGGNIQPASEADADTFVQTGDEHSSDVTSRDAAGWTADTGLDGADSRTASGRYTKRFFPPAPGTHGGGPIGTGGYTVVDRRFGATVSLHTLGDEPSTTLLGSGLTGFIGTPQGAALVNTPNGAAVLAIDDNAGTGYTAGTMALRQWNPGLKRWTLMGTLAPLNLLTQDEEGSHHVQSAYTIDGLGNLDGQIYASGVNPVSGLDPSLTTGNFGLFQLTFPTLRGGSVHATQRMSFPMLSAGGGMTGANVRGTTFVAAQFNLTHSGGPVPGMVLLEVDPRTNYIANAWSVADHSFTTAGGGQISSTFRPSGVAFVDGQVVLTGSDGSTATSYTIMPGDANRPSPRVTSSRSGPAAGNSHALAGEGGFNAPASLPMIPADRKATPIHGVDPIWLTTAYSRSTASSPAFRRMMRDTVLSVAANPTACASSAQIGSGLSNAIADHYNQQSGVNSALNQFYSSLPPDHPCRPNNPQSFGH